MSERIHTDQEVEPEAPAPQAPVRDSGPVEGARGNREVPPAPGTAHEDLEARLAAAETLAEERLNDLRRVAADFDNYRKRSAREQASLVQRASERLVKELLPVLDDLERALGAAEQHEEAQLEEGVKLVHRSLAEALRKEGVSEIEANGRFDPHVHEALLTQPSEAAEGTVVEVLQKGYRLGDRVLRPARVVVSAGTAAPEPDRREAETD
jgi:molecular chaperone GrpE